ncbi:hypothetical protein ASC66_01260 [Leifsonia sp. Root4]|uniref:phage tail tube protein n=1 Tax=Leifsonia sp. Root4 TaxID=1736525 RepID=UPI0006F4FA15|nr:hypothetical protein [Leifsonia sp. Root4]KQW07657.1 hypothetical protein ASC66_01260 [Leifsonia sp. Root4]
MTVEAGNARIFGSDLDAIYLAPLGTNLPTTIDEIPAAAFEDVGWLHGDGITESATGSKEVIRGHQGGRVVRTRMGESGTTVAFTALESKPQTKSLRYDEKSVTVTAGVRKVRRGSGQKVSARAAVIDIFDADNVTVKERLCIERLEIVTDGDRVFVNNDIAGFPFIGEVIGDYDSYEGAGAQLDTVWNLTISGVPAGGTYTLAVNGAATAPIAYNANAAAVAAAINALAGVTGVTGVSASGTSPIAITFLAAAAVTANGSALTGGTSPAATVVATP